MAAKLLTQSYVHHASDKHYENIAVGRLLDDVTKRFPNKEALVFLRDNTRKTFSQLHREVNQLAAGLVQFGLKPRDRVGIWADESYDWIKTDLAVATAGMISARLPVSSTPMRLLQLLEKLECRALVIGVTHTDPVKTLQEIIPSINMATESKLALNELPTLQYILSMSHVQQPWITNLEDIEKLGDQANAKEGLKKNKMVPTLDDVYTIVFTSGSTGLPKAVAIPNRRLQETADFMEYCHGITKDTIKSDWLVYPQINTMTSTVHVDEDGLMLGLGCTIVFPHPPQDTNAILEAIEKEKCNTAVFFPMHVHDIINHTNIHHFDLSSLKFAFSGGNLVSPNKLKVLSSIVGVEVQQTYGSTEAGIITGHTPSSSLDEKVSNAGFPVFHGEIKVCDENDGHILPIGKVGEVFFRGPTTFFCYWADEVKTKAVKRENNWYYTGDLGKMDKHGNLTIIGRKDSMIIKGAQNIYPAEIEHALTTHPKIKLHKVVAVPDVRFVNELCLCLVLKDGVKASEEEFKEYLKDQVDEFLIPRYVVFMESFPIMTSTGKLNEKELSKMAADVLQLTSYP